ncbi:hypothetical protein ML401_38675 [Bradyrhizobium sp. 62B]|nr:hypothetical protein ML401_38675 [Bradyrhizobium sp. 62B]
MTASRIVFSLVERLVRSVLDAIGTQSRQAAGEIKRRLQMMEAALFRGSEYMLFVIPGRLEEPNPE